MAVLRRPSSASQTSGLTFLRTPPGRTLPPHVRFADVEASVFEDTVGPDCRYAACNRTSVPASPGAGNTLHPRQSIFARRTPFSPLDMSVGEGRVSLPRPGGPAWVAKGGSDANANQGAKDSPPRQTAITPGSRRAGAAIRAFAGASTSASPYGLML